jgi:hypothetical protein
MQIPRSELRKDEVNDKAIECSWHKSISIPKRFIFGFFSFFCKGTRSIKREMLTHDKQASIAETSAHCSQRCGASDHCPSQGYPNAKMVGRRRGCGRLAPAANLEGT